MEQRFHNRLEYPWTTHLGDAIRDRRYAERPRLSIALRDVYPAHRRREITAGAHSIPQPIEIVFQILFELLNRLSVDSRCPLVCLHPFVRFPNFTFGNTKRF